jgi:hypothetical protein
MLTSYRYESSADRVTVREVQSSKPEVQTNSQAPKNETSQVEHNADLPFAVGSFV